MRENDSYIKGFLKDLKFVVPLVLTLLAGFGYQLFNLSIGIDDLVSERYVGGVLQSQGRFSSVFLHYLFGFEGFVPYVKTLFGVIFLFFGALLFCVVLKKASRDTLPRLFYTFFACAFVSYPLINEIFIYKGSDLNTGLGYALTAVGLLFAENAISAGLKNKRIFIVNFIYAIITWIFLMSLYEAFAFVYVMSVCLVLFIEKSTGKEAFRKIVLYAAPLVIGIIVEYLIGLIANSIFDFGYVGSTGSTIAFSSDVVSVIFQLYRKLCLAGLWYLPIGLFVVAGILSIPMFVVSAVKNKKPIIILYAFGVWLSLFALGILTAGCVKYRTCLNFGPFVAFVFAYIGYKLVKRFDTKPVKAAAFFLAIMLIVFQVIELNVRFSDNILRWNEEKQVLISVGEEIRENCDYKNKPVIFVGEYKLSDNIMSRKFVKSDDKIYVSYTKFMKALGLSPETYDYDGTYVLATAQSDFGSLISWGTDDKYACNEELLLAFEYLGFEFKSGTLEQYEELSSDTSAYERGINEFEDYVVYFWG